MSPREMASNEHGGDYQYSDTAATRHLCVGVYVDRSFRDLVIGRIHNDSRRRVAPSYGFDLVPVVRHAWWSWLLDVGEHVAIVGCVLGGLARGGPLAVVLVVCALALCCLLCRTARIVPEVCRLQAVAWAERFKRRELRLRPESPVTLLRKRERALKAVLAGCVVIVAAPVVVANELGASLGDAAPVARTLGCYLVASAALAGVLRQLLLNALYHAYPLRPPTLTRRELVIDEQQSHPCVVYQRPKPREGPDPVNLFPLDDVPTTFIGSGELVNRWVPPLTVPLLRPGPGSMVQREYTKPPFKAHELVERLRSALEQVGMDEGPANLPGLQVRDRIYIAEADVSLDRRLLHSDLNGVDLSKIIDNHQSPGHHFLEISMPIAGGELVTTVFLRVTVKARCLSLDVATCALTRTSFDYQVIDAFAEHGAGAVLRSTVRSVCTLPVEVWHVWRLLGIPLVLARALWSARDRTLIPRRRITVGARVAVRQEKADDWEDAQLDETIIYDHMKVIEQRILKTTEDFLKAQGVDTSMFEKRAMHIINSGVLNMGRDQNLNQSPFWRNAQVNQVNQYLIDPETNGESA